MGVLRKDGYSATVTGFLVVGDRKLVLARTNGSTFDLAQATALPPGTVGRLVVTVDDDENSREVILPDGAIEGNTTVNYRVTVPF